MNHVRNLESVVTRHRFRNNLITSPYQYVGLLTLLPLKMGPIRCLGESGKDSPLIAVWEPRRAQFSTSGNLKSHVSSTDGTS
jgi:hypothetical protein